MDWAYVWHNYGDVTLVLLLPAYALGLWLAARLVRLLLAVWHRLRN